VKVMPILAQLQQQMMQLRQQMMQMQTPPDPESQAILQASMAETQRRAAKDQADLQFKVQALQAELAQKAQGQQIEVAMNAENNLTQERIKTAELTVDEAKLRKEQEETAVKLNEVAQSRL